MRPLVFKRGLKIKFDITGKGERKVVLKVTEESFK